jgi:chorismate synthase
VAGLLHSKTSSRLSCHGFQRTSRRHVQQLLRQALYCHHLWRKSRAGDRLRDRRLSARAADRAEEFRHDLDRRATGKSRYTSQRHEADDVEILSGVYEGKTTGTPIALLIRNTDQRSKDYGDIAQTFRPGHADYTYWQKYGIRDPRGGGRSSARETTMRVAAAVIAKKWLAERYGVRVRGYLAQIGEITPRAFDWDAVEQNPFFWPDAAQVPSWRAHINALRKSGDSVGARVNVVADGVPPGWGEPIYGKLDGDLASALMSINAVKGVEIGDGFAAVTQRGSEHRDEMRMDGFTSNHAGGILGGISSGQPVTASIVLKPTSSILIPGHSVNLPASRPKS